MIKHTILALGHLAALTTAASQTCLAKGPAGYCKQLTWEAQKNQTGAPTIDECQQLCPVVSQDPESWFVNLTGAAVGEKRGLINGYPCHFSLGRGPGQGDPLKFSLANEDILGLIDGAVGRFGNSGHVAATGTMNCEGKNITWWID
ncbi:hypothetical protein PFICI_13533 [Pestalotiopsis fici W106-1]|uniref:Ecp2 effector protein-like domain-containing protein n=1 Tax=Pestalotiopsis fici (strain W106-1 / CGMCC3.15140) TaxID=1229662 RepID=W3WMQ7_PESFW|nr:uncharacterized protein PFICI_13533 [Pestalotiopsis fici W106-1]ETS75049.1 hypothetical protein PFICI_13533 [Pestalotiopsis fici W106-1]